MWDSYDHRALVSMKESKEFYSPFHEIGDAKAKGGARFTRALFGTNNRSLSLSTAEDQAKVLDFIISKDTMKYFDSKRNALKPIKSFKPIKT